MKFLVNFFALLGILSSTAAFAKPILVFDAVVNNTDEISARLQTNSKLNRAWVEITTSKRVFEEDETARYRVNVSGLRYDSRTKTIIFTCEGRTIVCGKKNCNLSARFEERQVDNGFEYEKRTYGVVTLNPE